MGSLTVLVESSYVLALVVMVLEVLMCTLLPRVIFRLSNLIQLIVFTVLYSRLVVAILQVVSCPFSGVRVLLEMALAGPSWWKGKKASAQSVYLVDRP